MSRHSRGQLSDGSDTVKKVVVVGGKKRVVSVVPRMYSLGVLSVSSGIQACP